MNGVLNCIAISVLVGGLLVNVYIRTLDRRKKRRGPSRDERKAIYVARVYALVARLEQMKLENADCDAMAVRRKHYAHDFEYVSRCLTELTHDIKAAPGPPRATKGSCE